MRLTAQSVTYFSRSDWVLVALLNPERMQLGLRLKPVMAGDIQDKALNPKNRCFQSSFDSSSHAKVNKRIVRREGKRWTV